MPRIRPGSITRGTATTRTAIFLQRQLEICPKTQKEIADELGYQRPNIISMWKAGAPIPLDRIASLADALDVDPAHLLRLVFEDYYPSLGPVLESAFGFALTRNEREIVSFVRKASEDSDPALGEGLEKGITEALEP